MTQHDPSLLWRPAPLRRARALDVDEARACACSPAEPPPPARSPAVAPPTAREAQRPEPAPSAAASRRAEWPLSASRWRSEHFLEGRQRVLAAPALERARGRA